MDSILVYSPKGKRRSVPAARLANRPESLVGKTVGFLHNEKGVASDTFFERDTEILCEMLEERAHIGGTVRQTKPLLSRVAPQEMVAFLASRADVVVNGIGK